MPCSTVNFGCATDCDPRSLTTVSNFLRVISPTPPRTRCSPPTSAWRWSSARWRRWQPTTGPSRASIQVRAKAVAAATLLAGVGIERESVEDRSINAQVLADPAPAVLATADDHAEIVDAVVPAHFGLHQTDRFELLLRAERRLVFVLLVLGHQDGAERLAGGEVEPSDVLALHFI